MSERTRAVQMELVEVMEPIVAVPGDRLLVWQGRCFGVDTSRPASEGEPPDKTPRQRSREALEGGKGNGKRGRPLGLSAAKATLYERIPQVLDKPKSKRQICEDIGIPFHRSYLDPLLDRLTKDGIIVGFGTTSNRLFRLVEQETAA